jgi:hypothetical protein
MRIEKAEGIPDEITADLYLMRVGGYDQVIFTLFDGSPNI